jgi:hypothetical protein
MTLFDPPNVLTSSNIAAAPQEACYLIGLKQGKGRQERQCAGQLQPACF